MEDYDPTEDFMKELSDLFKKYEARLCCDDHWQGYAECGQDLRMTIEFNKHYKYIEIGRYFDGEGVCN